VPAANLEAARILRPGGLFVALWNDRVVDGVGWMEEFETLIQRFNPAHERDYRDFDVAARMGQGGVFSDFLSAEFPNEWEVDTQAFIGFARTLSYVRDVVTPADLTRYEAEVRRLILVAHGKGSFVVPMKTRITIGRKSASA
jgi:SAM-dependent methyltransferase